MNNGEYFLQNPGVWLALATINVGNGRQATITRPGAFIITPGLDFSLVSVHVLARLGVGFNRFEPTSDLIGYVASPSGRDVLAIGIVVLEVELRVPVNAHLVSRFNGLVSFLVYREPPLLVDGLFSMGGCSLFFCYCWDQIPVSHNTSLALQTPLPLQQQHMNGNMATNTSINTAAITNTDSDNRGTC
ncbi:hypothetical protein GE21DRAFT_9186 [Neurospora crassa]|uniref:Uncharacterized protein n=1 Tax=Neurospora crassa (strain ATCC 24698 / 74-OR23-1A / CBS 708.71 / DSM 1257 / FGSC 987) TaxID=367110 RepID=Q7RU14_NEUCR|nr:hypothetical protein NCU03976 [Neurospora crassa OR74A]EAA27325.1 hypothetical protein NCU03976 [Neurospora crassa OR74A]KHE86283.1 hypothetical protein GE21DRAFT_9186 [Neurospora crassa]|eukprot:XP_956561.1 hypothetical protein NCU03976 [Neurospora crassa OR74A]